MVGRERFELSTPRYQLPCQSYQPCAPWSARWSRLSKLSYRPKRNPPQPSRSYLLLCLVCRHDAERFDVRARRPPSKPTMAPMKKRPVPRRLSPEKTAITVPPLNVCSGCM